jgi:hypothetical protein
VFGAIVLVVAAASVVGASGSIDRAATVAVPARRGEQSQVTATVPPPPGCHRVIVIGDSLMDNSRPWLVSGLRNAGFDAVVDAQPSRRIPSSVRAPYSGVKAALWVRASFGEAECWVVALGSNDLPYGGRDEAVVTQWIDEMLSAVTPGAHVWWVNVDYHNDPKWNVDFVAATRVFNATVTARAETSPLLDVIDWYSLAEAHRQWFFDPVHVDRTGSIARAELTVAALPSS